mgnify:CR=1 FL=1
MRQVPDAPLDPPEYPELPEPDEECSTCGKENWGTVEQKDENAVAQGRSMVPCQNCSGKGVIRVDENGATDDQDETTKEERTALLLAGAKCPECDGAKEVLCEGAWMRSLVPDEPDRRDD